MVTLSWKSSLFFMDWRIQPKYEMYTWRAKWPQDHFIFRCCCCFQCEALQFIGKQKRWGQGPPNLWPWGGIWPWSKDICQCTCSSMMKRYDKAERIQYTQKESSFPERIYKVSGNKRPNFRGGTIVYKVSEKAGFMWICLIKAQREV